MTENFEILYRNEITNKGPRLVSDDPKEQCQIIYDCVYEQCWDYKENILGGITKLDSDIDDLCDELANIRAKLIEKVDEVEVDELLHELDTITSSLSDNIDGIYD